jgi:hypothetical protein
MSCLANFFGLLPAVGTGALENEPAIERSPNPFEAAAAAPGLVIGVLTVRMMAGIDREHFDPDFSEDSALVAKLGQNSERDCTVWL